jgi:hypothetical protein
MKRATIIMIGRVVIAIAALWVVVVVGVRWTAYSDYPREVYRNARRMRIIYASIYRVDLLDRWADTGDAKTLISIDYSMNMRFMEEMKRILRSTRLLSATMSPSVMSGIIEDARNPTLHLRIYFATQPPMYMALGRDGACLLYDVFPDGVIDNKKTNVGYMQSRKLYELIRTTFEDIHANMMGESTGEASGIRPE